jgi:hypothetical protein
MVKFFDIPKVTLGGHGVSDETRAELPKKVWKKKRKKRRAVKESRRINR